MPTYEYECKKCHYSFEVFQSMSDEPLKTCPKCGKEIRRLIFGGAGVIFKGPGFYVTDKARGQTGGAAKTAAPGASGDAAAKDSGEAAASAPDTAKDAAAKSAATGDVGSRGNAAKETGDRAAGSGGHTKPKPAAKTA